METRFMKKQKQEEAAAVVKIKNGEETDQTNNSNAVIVTTDTTTTSSQNLLDLPFALLLVIFDLLISIPDLFSFSIAICRPLRPSWLTATSFPPLLLTPQLNILTSRIANRRSLEWGQVQWVHPPRSTIQTLALAGENARSYRSVISSETLTKHCVGYSYGYLIFVDQRRAILTDVFPGREVKSPLFPSDVSNHFLGILTAPLSSCSCVLVLVCLQCTIFWRLGKRYWVRFSSLSLMTNAMSVAIFKGQLYFMDYYYYGLTIVDLSSDSISMKRVKLNPPLNRFVYYGNFIQYLFELNGDLLLVLFGHPGYNVENAVEAKIYKLDFSKSEWLEVKSLGDCCLFIDAIGRCPIACPNPSRWGGRKNSLYIAGSGSNNWSIFGLDGSKINNTNESILDDWYIMWRQWPFPIWVYPSMLYN